MSESPNDFVERLEAAGFENVDVSSDSAYGSRRKVIVWLDMEDDQ